ncbi:hypothetical protein D7V64_09895 [Acinetobacter cumulans]|uniref:DUF342 domain-containing protein n=1 Tax=Acinetobacter cumulans TaxID=2136182 RepID=A0A3A8FZX2_9GAMM|nr:hypothetical protein [Acinetobacter cumulans]RKG52372.1 hypothetical protein D7V64_09895 [Acinetobacter cumulans]
MHNLKKQQGMATILLVLLIGITVMLITASVAKTLVTNREAGVAAHAQTNAQLMGWAGVSAFREYLLEQGKISATKITELNGKNVTLKYEVNKKEIIAKNIRVTGCTAEGSPCSVIANISSDNKTSQSATTIEATYNLVLKNGTASIAGEKSTINFSQATIMSGTALEAEVPNSNVTLNIDGYTSIQAGFTTKNISELTINSTGNVDIDCSFTNCGTAKININAKGYVRIVNPGNFGTIYATGDVMLTTGVNAENIYSMKNVNLTTNSTAQVIKANDYVLLTNATATDIYSNSNVTLTAGSSAKNISALGYVALSASSVKGNVEAADYILVSASTVEGYARAYNYVELNAGAKVYGNVYAKGLSGGPTLAPNSAVSLSASWIGGNVYTGKNLRLWDIINEVEIEKNVYMITGKSVVGGGSKSIKGSLTYSNSISELSFTIPRVVDTAAIEDYINKQTDFKTKVDVRVYKNEANYIFMSVNGFDRVYLNKLKNKKNNSTYLYENNIQYEVDSNGIKTLVSNNGFAIGDYTINGSNKIGAICKVAVSGVCTQEIIGFLPRISVGKTLGIDNDYDYLAGTWYVRSTSAASSIDNATFAPGTLYFDNKLIIAGNANLGADSMSNVFTNSFLAEGSIDAIAFSPRIYSPYNVLRAGGVSIICDRILKTINNSPFTDVPPTTPVTLSNKYLMPTNLCKSPTEFAYNMNTDANDNKLNVSIDGQSVPKLDLGYVALMSNKTIRIGACAQIYGDVLARGHIEGSAGCGITKNTNAIVGSVSTQGENSVANTFGAGSKIVTPKSEYTNTKETPPVTGTGTGLTAESSKLQWSKYL